MKELKPHPLAEIFPAMSDGEFEELCESINSNGQREPITLLDGMILDGRHRYKACLQVGIDPVTENLASGRTPAKFVIDKNIMRRNLTAIERTRAVQLCHDWMSSGGRPSTKPSHDERVSREDVAQQAGTSVGSVARVRRQIREERGEVEPKPEFTEPSRTEKQQMEMDALRERAERAEADELAAVNRAEQMEALAAKVLADEPEESLKTKIWNEGVGRRRRRALRSPRHTSCPICWKIRSARRRS